MLVRPESNSRPPAWEPDAQRSELPVRAHTSDHATVGHIIFLPRYFKRSEVRFFDDTQKYWIYWNTQVYIYTYVVHLFLFFIKTENLLLLLFLKGKKALKWLTETRLDYRKCCVTGLYMAWPLCRCARYVWFQLSRDYNSMKTAAVLVRFLAKTFDMESKSVNASQNLNAT